MTSLAVTSPLRLATKSTLARTSPVNVAMVGAVDMVGSEDVVGEALGENETVGPTDTVGDSVGVAVGCEINTIMISHEMLLD